MKKLFAIIAVAGFLAACNSGSTPAATADTTKKVDTAKAAADTTKKADTTVKAAADTTKK